MQAMAEQGHAHLVLHIIIITIEPPSLYNDQLLTHVYVCAYVYTLTYTYSIHCILYITVLYCTLYTVYSVQCNVGNVQLYIPDIHLKMIYSQEMFIYIYMSKIMRMIMLCVY